MNFQQLWNTIFRRPTLIELAAQELAEAQVKLLEAHTGQEFAASIISYNQTRIRRLREFLVEQTTSSPTGEEN